MTVPTLSSPGRDRTCLHSVGVVDILFFALYLGIGRMELFLNFVWILLFVPAWWVWRRNGRTFSSARCFLTLACVLVILFPVISATDDLHAAPQAMEEASSTKRTLKHGNLTKAQNHFANPPAHVTLTPAVFPANDSCADVPSMSLSLPPTRGKRIIGDRAPPCLSLI